MDVFVESEFALLRTDVLTQSEVALPPTIKDSPDLRFLPQEATATIPVGQNLREADPARQAAWKRENLREVLEGLDVQILRPRLLTAAERAPPDPTVTSASSPATRSPPSATR